MASGYVVLFIEPRLSVVFDVNRGPPKIEKIRAFREWLMAEAASTRAVLGLVTEEASSQTSTASKIQNATTRRIGFAERLA